MDGFIELTPEKLKTDDGVRELNRMLEALFLRGAAGDGEQVRVFIGYGTPEAQITAGVGSVYQRRDGGANTSIYIKETGTGATGWVAK